MSLSKARAALEELAKIVNINPAPSKKTRSGVIFSLRSKAGLVYPLTVQRFLKSSLPVIRIAWKTYGFPLYSIPNRIGVITPITG